jgi:hypothetical protein
MGAFERPKLLEDAGSARADPFGELVRGCRPVETQAKQEVATKGR